MQSQRQNFSRLGTAVLWRSVNISRSPSSSFFALPTHVLNAHRSLRIRAVISRNDNATQVEGTAISLVYRPLKNGSLREQVLDEALGVQGTKKPSDSPEDLNFDSDYSSLDFHTRFTLRRDRANQKGRVHAQAKSLRRRTGYSRDEGIAAEDIKPALEGEFVEDAGAPSYTNPNLINMVRRIVQHDLALGPKLSQRTANIKDGTSNIIRRSCPTSKKESINTAEASLQSFPQDPSTMGAERQARPRREEVSRVAKKKGNKAKRDGMRARGGGREITFTIRGIRAKPGRHTRAQAEWLSKRINDQSSKTIESSLASSQHSLNHAEFLSEEHSQATGTTLVVRRVEREPGKAKLQRAKRQRTKRQKARREATLLQQWETIDEQLDNCEWQLRIFGRWLEIWRHLHMAEKQLEIFDTELEMVARRIEIWERLDAAEKQLGHTQRQLEIIKRQVDLMRQGWQTANEYDLGFRGSPTLIEEASDITENVQEGGAEAQSDYTAQSVGTLLIQKAGSLNLKRRRRRQGRFLSDKKSRLLCLGRQVKRAQRYQMFHNRKLMKQAITEKGITGRRPARPLSTPSGILSCWLDTNDPTERENYWLKNRGNHRLSSLPLILVAYLRRSANPDLPLDKSDQLYLEASSAALHRRGFNETDVAEWAWILSAQDTKSMVTRLTSTASRKPTFVLFEILRRDVSDVRSLKLLLNYSWDLLQGNLRSNLVAKSEAEVKSIIPQSTTLSHASQIIPSVQSLNLDATSFFLLFRGLLRHARRIWPLAIVSISHMVAPFIDLQLGKSSSEPRKLDNLTHLRLCKVFNQMLRVLALPASINPYKSTAYNWRAQRVLLELTTHFQPPLLLDRNSYRAVAQILAASKKSKRESKAAALRTRSWPPWRVDQDGMDAQRSPEDDMSRVIAIATQAKESGYSEDEQDRAVKVLGGQEPDGTPTIPTRKLFRFKERRRRRPIGFFQVQAAPDARDWTARIESTRDVQEAWSAFNSYQEAGRRPTISMYFAMIAKLQYEEARMGRLKQHIPSPGDGKEVWQPSDDNFSNFYRTRLQPPTADELYRRMRLAKYRPSGRFLIFLIQHARTPGQARMFMADSRISHLPIAILKGTMAKSPDLLKILPERILTAYIAMLCRFAPRAIVVPPHEDPGAATRSSPGRSEWRILELHNSRNKNQRDLDIYLHVAELLKISQPRFRPAWYQFFSALAWRDVVVDRSFVGRPKNDILSWKVLAAALNDFHNCGLELDPRGFQIICNGLEKAILASCKISEEENEEILDISQIRIVVDEFMRLSEAVEPSHPTIPTLLHPIEGAHLHAYVRVLGLSEAHDDLMYVIRWMVQHHVVLDDIASQAENGLKLIKRTITAMKVFLSRTEHEAEAEELVNRVQHWGGWPSESESQEYINRGSGWPEGEDGEP